MSDRYEDNAGLPVGHWLRPEFDARPQRLRDSLAAVPSAGNDEAAGYAQKLREHEARIQRGHLALLASGRDTPFADLIRSTATRIQRASLARKNACARAAITPRERYWQRVEQSREASAELNAAIREQRTLGNDAAAEALRRAFYARSQAMGSPLSLEAIEVECEAWRLETLEFLASHECGPECGLVHVGRNPE
jgi:hypothetical protein